MNTAHRGARIAAALAAVTLGVTACGSDSKSSFGTVDNAGAPSATASPSIGGDAGQVVSAKTAATPADAATPGLVPPAVDLPVVTPTDNKYLAIDVSYGIEVNDITKGISDVIALSDRHGGQIFERKMNITDDQSSSASFVIKLPPKEVEPAIAELGAIGVRRTASQGTEDVTGQAVDIDARLVTAQASLDRVRKLLDAATDLGQVLSLESQLTERETLVEQLVGQKRAIADRVSLATLRLQLSLPAVPTTATGSVKAAAKPTIGKAFRSGWKGFVHVLAAIMIFIGYTAPFLVIAAIGAALLIPISRRRRGQRAQQSRSGVPPPPPVPVADQQTTERDSVGAARNP